VISAAIEYQRRWQRAISIAISIKLEVWIIILHLFLNYLLLDNEPILQECSLFCIATTDRIKIVDQYINVKSFCASCQQGNLPR
jgi:hypothetical protein